MKKMLKGFTLVEIMIVVAIIAILAAVAIPNFVKYRRNAQAASCVSNLKQIQTAKEQWMMANGSVPSDLDQIAGNTDKYIKKTPTCPAGGEYTIGADGVDPTCGIGTTLAPSDKATWHVLDKDSVSAGGQQQQQEG